VLRKGAPRRNSASYFDEADRSGARCSAARMRAQVWKEPQNVSMVGERSQGMEAGL
jgi:hypothetical protein